MNVTHHRDYAMAEFFVPIDIPAPKKYCHRALAKAWPIRIFNKPVKAGRKSK